MCPLCYTAEAIFIPPNCRPIRTHLQSQSSRECPEGPRGVVVVASARGGGDDTSCSSNVGVYPFTGTRCVGSRWRLRGDTIFIDVCILGCCFGLCSAGARQCSNSIEERVNRDATGIEPNIFDLWDRQPHHFDLRHWASPPTRWGISFREAYACRLLSRARKL